MAVASIKASLLCLSLVLLSFACTINGQTGKTADIGNKTYFFVTGQKANWYQANLGCSTQGMSLASIKSETEYTNLKNYLNNQDLLDAGFWLSGSNSADSTNTDFTWFSNGNKLSYTQWAAGQPGSTAGICIYTNAKFKWETQDCGTTTAANYKYYICSRPLVPNCGITGRCKRSGIPYILF